MSLTPQQIELVQKTWAMVLTSKKQAGEIFYDRLFTIDPSLRSLFKGDINAQSTLLIGMITFAVNKLDNVDSIVADVKALGIRHKKYNVKPAQYQTVAEALLWTLEMGLENDWTPEVQTAWVAVYTLLSTTMIAAAAEAE
jgi:hemoglobin-like flavoprotein